MFRRLPGWLAIVICGVLGLMGVLSALLWPAIRPADTSLETMFWTVAFFLVVFLFPGVLVWDADRHAGKKRSSRKDRR